MSAYACVRPRVRRPCVMHAFANPYDSPCCHRDAYALAQRWEPDPKPTRADRARWRRELFASKCRDLSKRGRCFHRGHRITALRRTETP